MTDRPLISVIIPVYNVEKYLRRCIESVIGQTYQNLEILLVDDGSSDGSPQICDEYAEKDSRITVLHISNSGPSAARNKALEICTGDYVGFVDSDDWISPDMYEILYDNLQENNADVSIVGYAMVWPSGKTQKQSDENLFYVWTHDQLMEEWISQRLFKGFMCDKLFKKKLFQNVAFPEDRRYMEDVAIGIELYDQCDKAVYTGKCCYYYFQREDSATNIRFSERELIGIKEAEKMIVYSEQHENKFDKAAYSRLIIVLFTIIDRIIYTKKREYYRLISDLKRTIRQNSKYINSGYINSANRIFIRLLCLGVPAKWLVVLRHFLLNLRRSV
ncbi:MAG TPA: glycosyltransferase family 2 protein [Candidatus Mediterraneibacter norfolkensis]|nr:glycosyltransferase family 2 protein [Candidatus Mediterraneibacter norfolkensis]